MSRHSVVITAFDGVELLDIAGPVEVFATADRLLGPSSRGYRTVIAGARRGPIRCAGGTSLVAEVSWDELDGQIDTVVVPGGLLMGDTGPAALVDPALVDWISTLADRPSRIASVCTGAHSLAAAGLLTGRRATTHWATAAQLAGAFPDLRVEPEAIFIQDAHIWTSAGVSAGIDLALALIAADHTAELARRTARWLVMYLRRPGGQHQFSELLARPTSTDAHIARLQEWIAANLSENLANEALAARAGLSPRHFSRVFRRQVGIPPARYVESARADAAARLLVHTNDGLGSIARSVGLGSVSTLHRVFKQHFSTSPAAYRHRFTTT
ncbi:GlxA family transcriptional regulator [Nocardia grenadensis]|uniref:GlxA family transcriptional regulator n=1 Tax=Nocardia grenadensis TaxID=931537 RepID=UPI003D8C2678